MKDSSKNNKERVLTLQLSNLVIMPTGRTSHALASHSQLLCKCSNQIVLLLELLFENRELLELL